MGPGFESLEVHQTKKDNPRGYPFFVSYKVIDLNPSFAIMAKDRELRVIGIKVKLKLAQLRVLSP